MESGWGCWCLANTYLVRLLKTHLLNVPQTPKNSPRRNRDKCIFTHRCGIYSLEMTLKSKLDAGLIVLSFVGHMAGVSLPVSLAGLRISPLPLPSVWALFSARPLSLGGWGELGALPRESCGLASGLDKHRAGPPRLLDHPEVNG